MDEDEGDVLSYAAFPAEYCQKAGRTLETLALSPELRARKTAYQLLSCPRGLRLARLRRTRQGFEIALKRDPAVEDDVRLGRGLAGADDELGLGDQTL